MMSSMISTVLMIALFLGNISFSPASIWQIRSGELKFKIETKLNQPLEEEMLKTIGGTQLDSLSAEFDIEYKISEDFKKLEMHCDILLSNNIDEEIKMSYWVNLDHSDKNIPKSLIIIKQDNDEKYYVINIQSPVTYNQLNGMLGGFMSLNEQTPLNFDATGIEINENDGVYTAVADEAALKKVIRNLVLEISNYLAPMFAVNTVAYSSTVSSSTSAIGGSDGPTEIYSNMEVTTPDEIQSQISTAINEFFDKLENVKIFADEAFVFTAISDDKNQPKNIHYDININTNIAELSNVINGYQNENMPVESSNIDLTISFDYEYSSVNEDIVIDYPELTAHNSIDIMGQNQSPEININNINVIHNNNLAELNSKPFIKDNTVYVPLREVLNLNGFSDEEIIWNDGIIFIDNPDRFGNLRVGSSQITWNSREINVGAEVILDKSVTYVPASVLESMNIANLSNIFYDDYDNIIGAVVLMIPQYIPRESYNLHFMLPSDVEPMWEKYVIMSGDKAGLHVQPYTGELSHYLERTNLIIASGEPTVIIGKFEDEFINKLQEQGAIFPAIPIDDEYTILIPQTVGDYENVKLMTEYFISLIMTAE